MPLIVKDYKWRQSDGFVIIQIPSHGVPPSKIDLFTSPNYIKTTYEKWFFEAFLLHSINVAESKCTKTSTEIIFELLKSEEQYWECLEINLPKKDKQELKKKYIEEEHLKLQQECQKRFEKKTELKRLAVREQIEIDTKQRDNIEKIKNDEKITALGDFHKWHNKIEPKCIEIDEKDNDVIRNNETDNFKRLSIYTAKKRSKLKPSVPTPLPRKSTTIRIDFTARNFPTPSRESQLAEEEEWLKKQAEVRRSVGFISEDLRPEEKNPLYLNSKGQEFLKAGNYLGAISAFSFGIKLCDQFPDLYIGRSEAHFKQENFCKCAQDCSFALELLIPAVSSNLEQRVTCISRRGLALQRMGYLRESINELEVAVKLSPHNENIRNALQEVKAEYEKNEEREQK